MYMYTIQQVRKKSVCIGKGFYIKATSMMNEANTLRPLCQDLIDEQSSSIHFESLLLTRPVMKLIFD